MNSIASRSMTARMIGAARLDVSVYEEVEADSTATGQAAGVVAIVALCSAIGGIGAGAEGVFSGLIAALVGWAIWAGVTYLIGGIGAGAQGVFSGMIAALVGWAIWAGVTYLIGDKLLGGTATWGELLRTLGFAQAPGVLFALGAVPLLGWLVSIAVGLWILITGIVAIRQALNFGTGRAVATAVLGFIPYVILAAVLRPG